MKNLEADEIKAIIKRMGRHINIATSDRILEAILTGDNKEIANKAMDEALKSFNEADNIAGEVSQYNSDIALGIKQFINFCRIKILHDVEWGDFMRNNHVSATLEFKNSYQQFVAKSREIEDEMQKSYYSISEVLHNQFGFRLDDIETERS